MEFSNQEIVNHIGRVERNFPVDIRYKIDDQYVGENEENNFDYLIFDGDKEELFIMFVGEQTSICLWDKLDMLFISDKMRSGFPSSETQSRVVYEGELDSKAHSEILDMFSQIVDLIGGAIEVQIEEAKLPRKPQESYQEKEYVITVHNPYAYSGRYVFNNIAIIVQ